MQVKDVLHHCMLPGEDAVSMLCNGDECPLRLQAGRAETRPGHYLDIAGYDPASGPELWLCYATEGGLLNQHLAHINGASCMRRCHMRDEWNVCGGDGC